MYLQLHNDDILSLIPLFSLHAEAGVLNMFETKRPWGHNRGNMVIVQRRFQKQYVR